MSALKRPGISLPGYRTRARTSLLTNCKGIWDLTGGDGDRAVKNLVPGQPDLLVTGSPVWTRHGAILSGADWLDTQAVSGASQLTLAVVAQRSLQSQYIGNYNGNAIGDSLIDNADGETVLRYWNGAAVNFEIVHDVPLGDFFLFVGVFGNSTRGHVFGAGDVEVEDPAGPSGRDHSVDDQTIRLGRGVGTSYTSGEVLVCWAGVWHDVLSADLVATELAPMALGAVRRHGVYVGRAA
jgi:hypothetical protein